VNGNERSLFATSSMHACTVRLPLAVVLSRRPGLSHSPSLHMYNDDQNSQSESLYIVHLCHVYDDTCSPQNKQQSNHTHSTQPHTHTHTHCGRSCVCETCDPRTARWLDHLRARATSVDADSMPELGHGLCKPWHWPWSGRRPWTEWKSAFVRRALFSLSSAFERPGVTTSPERPNDKGYLKCEACDHWLPRLWDKKNSLCARCSGNRSSSVHGSTESSREV
jgi:hypothetical protein